MRLIVAAVAVMLCGCRSRLEEQDLVGNRDLDDVKVFLYASGLDVDQFQSSKSLQSQYDRWHDGKIDINATSANAKREADDASAMAAVSLGISAGSR